MLNDINFLVFSQPMRYLLLFQESHSIGNLQCEIMQLFVVQDMLERHLVLHNAVCGCNSRIPYKYLVKINVSTAHTFGEFSTRCLGRAIAIHSG